MRRGIGPVWLGGALLSFGGISVAIGCGDRGSGDAPPKVVEEPAQTGEHYVVEIQTDPSNAKIEFDGRTVGEGSFVMRLKKDGTGHIVRVSLDGYRPEAARFTDVPPPVHFRLLKHEGPEPPKEVVHDVVAPPRHAASSRRRRAWASSRGDDRAREPKKADEEEPVDRVVPAPPDPLTLPRVPSPLQNSPTTEHATTRATTEAPAPPVEPPAVEASRRTPPQPKEQEAPPSRAESTAPAPAKPLLKAKTRLADLDVNSPLPREVAEAELGRTASRLAACYQAAAQHAGRDGYSHVRVRFVVDETGGARRVQADGAALPGLNACIGRVILALRFRPRPTRSAAVSFKIIYERP